MVMSKKSAGEVKLFLCIYAIYYGKDHRDIRNRKCIQAVMDGNIDNFISAYLGRGYTVNEVVVL